MILKKDFKKQKVIIEQDGKVKKVTLKELLRIAKRQKK